MCLLASSASNNTKKKGKRKHNTKSDENKEGRPKKYDDIIIIIIPEMDLCSAHFTDIDDTFTWLGGANECAFCLLALKYIAIALLRVSLLPLSAGLRPSSSSFFHCSNVMSDGQHQPYIIHHYGNRFLWLM